MPRLLRQCEDPAEAVRRRGVRLAHSPRGRTLARPPAFADGPDDAPPPDLAVAFAATAAALNGVKGQGTVRRVANAAAKRCLHAIARTREIAARPVHVSIPVDEQEALAALALDGELVISRGVLDRLVRRELVEDTPAGLNMTARGRAVAAGKPPGDLVPFAHFVPGVRVELAADLVLEDREVPAGELFEVVEAKDGRLMVYDGGLQLGPCHPRIFFVLRGEG